jgi:antirestriction protein ArdC
VVLSQGFGQPIKQWAELGAQVRKGEKSTQIIFWKQMTTEETEESEDDNKIRMFARYSAVFNADQVDGFEIPENPKPAEILQIESCTNFVEQTGAIIEHGHDGACYQIGVDKIKMPEIGLIPRHQTQHRNRELLFNFVA